MDKLFDIKDLKKHYPVLGGVFRRPIASVKALDGIDLDIYRGECLGLVGDRVAGKPQPVKPSSVCTILPAAKSSISPTVDKT